MIWRSTGTAALSSWSTSVATSVETHDDALGVGEVVDGALEGELAADAALLDPAVGHPGQLAQATVHLHPAGVDLMGGAQRLADVAAPDIGGKAVVAVVGHPDRLLLVLPGDRDQDRAEDLLTRDPPAV